MITVLLTDGEFTGLIRTLRAAYGSEIRIIGLSSNHNMPQQAMLDGSYFVTPHTDPQYLPSLFEILKKESVDYIFPIVTEGLELISEKKDEIFDETGAKVISAPLQALQTANDKGLLYQHFKENKTKLQNIVPEYYFADTKQQMLDGIRKIEKNGKQPCIKKRRGEDAGGFWKIDNQADYVHRLFFEPASRMLSVDMLSVVLDTLSSDDPIPPYLVCEYLPGEEWDCDVLAKDGKLLCVTTRINVQMSGGLTTVLEVKPNRELADYCTQIVADLGLSYVSCISFKKDQNGSFRLLEINPRMMGNIYVSCLAGNNYAKLSIDLFEGKNVHIHPVKSNIRTSMYYDQIQIPTDEK